MALRSTTRSLQYILLVLCLCAPIRAIAAPAAERDRATEFATLRVPCPTVLIIRGGRLYDHGRQFDSASSFFTVVPFENPAVDPGHFVRTIEHRTTGLLWIPPSAGQRSPPIS